MKNSPHGSSRYPSSNQRVNIRSNGVHNAFNIRRAIVCTTGAPCCINANTLEINAPPVYLLKNYEQFTLQTQLFNTYLSCPDTQEQYSLTTGTCTVVQPPIRSTDEVSNHLNHYNHRFSIDFAVRLLVYSTR